MHEMKIEIERYNPRNMKGVVPASLQAHYQRKGLIADAHETYQHPSGSFSLIPASGPGSRMRVRAGSTTAQRICIECSKPFVPREARFVYCNPRCSTLAKERRGRGGR